MKRKILNLLMLLCISVQVFAQGISTYVITADTVEYSSIVSTGTAFSFSNLDDGYATCTLPFSMPFGNTTIASGTTISVSSNGYICIGGTSSATGTTCPTSGTSHVINPLINQDAHLGRYSNSGAYYESTSNSLTIEYVGLGRYNSPYGYMSYQVTLNSDGTIYIVYDSVDVVSGTTLKGVLRDGTAGTTAYFGGSWAEPTISSSSLTFPNNKMPERGLRYKLQPSSGQWNGSDFWAICPTGQKLYYRIKTSNTVAVYGWYSSVVGDIIIPPTVSYNGTTYTVAEMVSDAFQECSITSVVIPSTITTIPKDAFYKCYSLTSVTIPNSVTSIGNYAFYNCSGLTSVTIGNSVTSIGNSAFSGCTGLTTLNWNAKNCTSVGGFAASAFYNRTSLTQVNIGDSVKVLPPYFLDGCSGLTSIAIPNSVTSIGDYAFRNCNHLTSVTIPNSVTSIGSYAFSGCSSLASVTIPNSVTSIGSSAFYGCSGLTSVNYLGTIDDWCNIDFTSAISNPLAYSHNLSINGQVVTELAIPAISQIKSYAFYGCSGLTSVTIGNGVTSIGSFSFENCSGLTSITIPNSVTSIEPSAFSGCTGLTEITCNANPAPSLNSSNPFSGVNSQIPVNIPCGSSMSYYSRWSYFSNFVEGQGYTFSAQSNDNNMGSVTVLTQPTCSSPQAVVNAVANDGYRFDHWSNGVTTNPYTFTLTQDTSISAYFVLQAYDTIIIRDTIETFVHDTVTIIDSVPYNVYIHDTTIIDNYIHDTTYVDVYVPVHDTTYIDNYIHDTTYVDVYVPVHDTTYIDNYIHDTTYVDVYVPVHDTTYIDNYIHDTTYVDVYVPVHDTTYIDNYIHDTTYVDVIIYDTVINTIYDTIIQTETIINNVYDTITLYDTIINTIYDTITIENTDTIYITETPCARVSTYIYATINPGEIYSMNGFNEVSAGVYTHNFETYDGCDSTVTLILSVNSSLENISRDVTLKLYPNPTQDNVVLNLDGIEKDSRIFLTDIQGRRIREYILKADEKTLRIDMQDLESGAYYLRIVSDNFQRTEKIIKK